VTLTARNIEDVQSSFAHVAPLLLEGTAADLFYDRLFALDPSLRPLFKEDMRTQKKALVAMLAAVVKGLDRLDELVPTVQALGRRHAGYGVRDAHYATVGAALLWTLEQGLGERFTPAAREAWTAAYTVLATTMQDAARELREAS